MAAVGQKQLTWCDDTPETQVTVTYCDHLKGLPTKDIVTRSGLVLGAAADCAAWGALVGAATPAPGGAGIGAIIGAVIGATCMGGTITGVDKRRHNADVERYPTEGIEGLNQVLLQAEYEADDLCGILNAVPLQPVRLDGERQVYEFSALRHWVQEHGTSPITRNLFSTAEIVQAPDAIARIGKLCHQVLHMPQMAEQLTPVQKSGIAFIRMKNKKFAQERYQSQKLQFEHKLRTHQINELTFFGELGRITAELYPALGNEGSEIEYERVPRNMKPEQAGPARLRYDADESKV